MTVGLRVSIIIPCYNSGSYIHRAIHSALRQTYRNVEIIVVDDGSTDHTKGVVSQFSDVIYFYQKNSGVSRARNVGASLSSGKYLVFLDADDWLFPNSVDIQMKYFTDHPNLALVSGCHMKINSQKHELYYKQYEVKRDNYLHMLKSNYIGPPIAAMFDKEIFLKYRFNETYRYSEDYDLYLRISKSEKILHHSEFVAAYYIHPESVSANRDILMMESSLFILKSVLGENPTTEEIAAYKIGVKNWKNLYTHNIYWSVFRDKSQKKRTRDQFFLLKHNPGLFGKYLMNLILGR